jgi:hypothetical protein
VDIYVMDKNGQEVARDIHEWKDCHVEFFVREGQRFRVQIKNLGPGDARCTITHNGTLISD